MAIHLDRRPRCGQWCILGIQCVCLIFCLALTLFILFYIIRIQDLW